jgi:nucleotide-binding universal stress UspA family protein
MANLINHMIPSNLYTQNSNKEDASASTNIKDDRAMFRSYDRNEITKKNIPSFKKILVTYDGKGISDKAINYSIYFSKLSGAELVILQVMDYIDDIRSTKMDVTAGNSSNSKSSSIDETSDKVPSTSSTAPSSNSSTFSSTSSSSRSSASDNSPTGLPTGSEKTREDKYSVNAEGHIIDEMEEKVRTVKETGIQSKVSYRIRTGSVVDEIINEITESQYDLVVLSSSHIDSWIKSLFSDTRKIIGNTVIPVLLLR